MVKDVINVCWWFFKWSALLVLAVVAFVPYAYLHFDDELRGRIEAKIAQEYPHLRVTVQSTRLVADKGIEIRGVLLSSPTATGPPAKLCYIDELFLFCKADLQALAHQKLDVSHVRVVRPVLRSTRQPSRPSSLQQLLPLPKFGDSCPTIAIEDGRLESYASPADTTPTVTLRDANFQIKPIHQDGQAETDVYEAEVSLAADALEQAKCSVVFRKSDGSWQSQGSLKGIAVSPQLWDSLPPEIASHLSKLRALSGRASLAFAASHAPASSSPYQFNIDGTIQAGRLDDARLPVVLDDLAAHFVASNTGVRVDSLSARAGQTMLKCEGHLKGLSAEGPAEAHLIASHLRLDKSLAERLPKSLRSQWNHYQPVGLIDVDAKVTFDGAEWKASKADVTLRDVAFSCDKFDYPLTGGTGNLSLANDVLHLNIVGRSGGRPVTIQGRVDHPGPAARGFADITATQMPIDKKLLDALKPETRKVIASLRASGTVDVVARIERDPPEAAGQRPVVHRAITVKLHNGSLNYDKFAYPIYGIGGTVKVDDQVLTFSNLRGSNGTAIITCHGNLRPDGAKKRLTLDIEGFDVPLEPELRAALPPGAQHGWDAVRPQGVVDLKTRIGYLSGTPKPHVDLTVIPQPDVCTIKPVQFPYRLENLAGTARYLDGHVTLSNMVAHHGTADGRARAAANGEFRAQADGGWRLHLKDITVDRLRADRDLAIAMPKDLNAFVAAARPTGAFNLHNSELEFIKSADPRAPMAARWHVRLTLLGNDLDYGVPLKNLSGSVHLRGSSSSRGTATAGELDLDTATLKDFQLTQVRGPFSIDSQQIVFGSRALNDVSRRPLSAELFGGMVTADCEVSRGSERNFKVIAKMDNASLRRLATERLAGRQKIKGQLYGNIVLVGNARGIKSFRGAGDFSIREAQVYELPLMVALLKTLSLRAPDSTAFDKSDVTFRIDKGDLLFDNIKLTGDAVSLLGNGRMTSSGAIDLIFYTLVGRDEIQLPLFDAVVSAVVREASQQTMRIRITGTVDDPKPVRNILPGVNRILERLQAEFQNGGQQSTQTSPSIGGGPTPRRY